MSKHQSNQGKSWSGFQATHVLKTIGDQNPSEDGIQRLCNGFLPCLITAIELGALPDLDAFREHCGLGRIIKWEDLPKLDYPDWVKTSDVLTSLRKPAQINLAKIVRSALADEHNRKARPAIAGHTVLDTLVSSYASNGDHQKYYQVRPSDNIGGHFGVQEITYLKNNWKSLPEFFRLWAKGMRLHGFAGLVRDKNGALRYPSLICMQEEPLMQWSQMSDTFTRDDILLYD